MRSSDAWSSRWRPSAAPRSIWFALPATWRLAWADGVVFAGLGATVVDFFVATLGAAPSPS
jgi:hypothetical protein